MGEAILNALYVVWSQGWLASSVFTFAFVVVVYVYLRRARLGLPIPQIRKIAGLEAVDEAVGRATEMGRPIHYNPGDAWFDAQGFAAFAVLSYVAKLCAKYDTRIIVTNRDWMVYVVLDEIVKQAFLEAGRPDSYNPDDVRYLSAFQFAHAAAVLGIMVREKVAANFMIGRFYGESLVFAESGYQQGAVQIAATDSTSQLPFFVATCDYTLIGEELFAAGAYLSRDPMLTGTVVAQDRTRMVIAALIIIGTIAASFFGSSEWLAKLITL
jgi:hypothetical protein